MPFHLLSDRAEAVSQHEWYRDYLLNVEGYRGLDALDDNLYAGLFQATLRPGESLTIVGSTDATPTCGACIAIVMQQCRFAWGIGLRRAAGVRRSPDGAERPHRCTCLWRLYRNSDATVPPGCDT